MGLDIQNGSLGAEKSKRYFHKANPGSVTHCRSGGIFELIYDPLDVLRLSPGARRNDRGTFFVAGIPWGTFCIWSILRARTPSPSPPP